jgi:hypothetical protein
MNSKCSATVDSGHRWSHSLHHNSRVLPEHESIGR